MFVNILFELGTLSNIEGTLTTLQVSKMFTPWGPFGG